MATRSCELQMLDLFRLHFFGSRRASGGEIGPVSPNQSFVLSELVRRECPSLDELRGVLKLHVSSLSRAISYLASIGLVTSTKDPRDTRRVQAVPTQKGVEVARQSWLTQQATIAKRLRTFSPDERSRLEEFLKKFIGEDAYRRIIPVPDEPEMAIISRAMTYDHGVVSDNYLESGYSVLDWIILSEIHYQNRAPGELARLCRTPPSTISLRLKKLQNQGLLSVSKGSLDRRARDLVLLAKGQSELRAIEEAATRYFARTLRSLPVAEIEQGLELFGRYVHELVRDLKTEYQIQKTGAESIDTLRRSLLGVLAALGDRYPLSATLLSPENQIVTLHSGSNPVLVLECEQLETGAFRLVNSIPLVEGGNFPSLDAVTGSLENYFKGSLKVPQSLRAFLDSLPREVSRASE